MRRSGQIYARVSRANNHVEKKNLLVFDNLRKVLGILNYNIQKWTIYE